MHFPRRQSSRRNGFLVRTAGPAIPARHIFVVLLPRKIFRWTLSLFRLLPECADKSLCRQNYGNRLDCSTSHTNLLKTRSPCPHLVTLNLIAPLTPAMYIFPTDISYFIEFELRDRERCRPSGRGWFSCPAPSTDSERLQKFSTTKWNHIFGYSRGVV